MLPCHDGTRIVGKEGVAREGVLVLKRCQSDDRASHLHSHAHSQQNGGPTNVGQTRSAPHAVSNPPGRLNSRPTEGCGTADVTEFRARESLVNGSTRGKNKIKQKKRRAAETKRRSSTAGTGWVVDAGGGRKGKRGATLPSCLTGSAQSQDGCFPGRCITASTIPQLRDFFFAASATVEALGFHRGNQTTAHPENTDHSSRAA